MEENKEEIFRKIQEALQNIPDNFSILEEQIDLDIQMEYFKFSKKIKDNLNQEEVLERIDDLFNPAVDDLEKKRLMISLASIDSVEAFRALEKYFKHSDPSLYQWAVLAMQESRMLIESSILGEKKMFISTGLGGKGDLLRYFAVFIGKSDEEFSDREKKVLNDELDFSLSSHDALLEKIDFHDGYVAAVILIPIRQSIKEIFDNIIKECNQLGDFLDEDMILTNVKEFNESEILEIITSKRDDSEDFDEDGFAPGLN